MRTKSFDKMLKKYDLIKDQKGILRRFLREKNNWNEHLEHTKQFILKHIDENIKSIAVLGSGWLLDFPLLELSEKKLRIDLFDLYLPKELKHRLRTFNQITFNQIDLTGDLIDFIQGLIKRKEEVRLSLLNEHLLRNQLSFDQYDLVISLNILSQLPVLIEENILEKHSLTINSNEFKRYVQNYHLNYLPKGKSILITDYEENYYKKDILTKTKKLIYSDIDFEKEDVEKWIWKFDTNRMYETDYDVNMKVGAIKI